LIQAVSLLMRTTPLPQITRGLSALLLPLRWFGFDHQAFARRLGLVLEQVAVMQARLSAARQHHPDSWADAATALVLEIEAQAPESCA
jgi:hypothetical protein